MWEFHKEVEQGSSKKSKVIKKKSKTINNSSAKNEKDITIKCKNEL